MVLSPLLLRSVFSPSEWSSAFTALTLTWQQMMSRFTSVALHHNSTRNIWIGLILFTILLLPQTYHPLFKTCAFLTVIQSFSHWPELWWALFSSMVSLISPVTSKVNFQPITAFIFFLSYFIRICQFSYLDSKDYYYSLLIGLHASCCQCNSFPNVKQELKCQKSGLLDFIILVLSIQQIVNSLRAWIFAFLWFYQNCIT